MKANINRRHFLRGSGALIALPALQSLGYKAHASSKNKTAVIPKRMVCLGIGFGVTQETWLPDKKDTGFNYKLSEGLSPLARHKKDFSIVQGCTHQYSQDAHYGSTFWLTGANRYAVPGQKFSNSISLDQLAANQFGAETRFKSIQLDSEKGKAAGHGPGLSLAWDQNGKPVSGLDEPIKLFHKLFSEEKMPLEQRQAIINKKRSVLDAVLTEAKRVQRGLSKSDTDKVDEYFQSIRDIETRLTKDEQWLSIPKTKAPLAEPKEGLQGKEAIKTMYDLMAAALQTDSTRVMTYRMPGQTLLDSIGVTVSSHNVSHYGSDSRKNDSRLRDKTHSELLAGLFDKLKAIKEADGSSLFDHTSLVFGSNIRSIH
ncbi:DUF1552 domain-containing protein [Lentisphaera marina]|uniref:DUF1552 domain-containing protein n=1 Tax=Lentisphaera marina TaxID=1111041 RepID=UPI002366FEA3|nr:DUF1552 domain-containing protein [Lentisphaera marina]MDD7985101.1 DUF1552 domain-containing protein [Lentisphaera marina]